MLQSLHVKNFAIIDETEVEFKEHLNIMSGETGAGKSILIGSVNAALGGKVSKDSIRQGADYALIELTFSNISDTVCAMLKEMDVFPEDGFLILSRKIMENGKNVCRINGENVSTGVLREAASCLIDIHGQQENQTLLKSSSHLALLDRFCASELGTLPEELKKEYRNYIQKREELFSQNIGEEEKNREVAYLKFAIDEISAAKLVKGEDIQAEEDYRILSNARMIKEALASCLQYSCDDENGNADDYISQAERQLGRVTEHDKKLSQLMEQLSTIEDSLQDFTHQVREYLLSMEDSEERFIQVEERLDLLNRFKAKYGKSIEEILTYLTECNKKLEKYDDYDTYLERIRKDYEKAEKICLDLCKKISKIRVTKAKELSEKVQRALLDLNFAQVTFELPILQTEQFHENGYDSCEFMISLNPGEEVKPLTKVASGGELSRIMLALKSVLADKDAIPTLIFDEIDTGISGRTAQKVSEKLAQISASHQILCITHLAQIAAMADTHFVIEKETVSNRVKTTIHELNREDTIEELARILGGVELTQAVYDNAREMKELADSRKKY